MIMKPTKLTLAASVSLYNLLETILFERKEDENGKAYPAERDFPFNVKVKIQKNLNILIKDMQYFETANRSLFEKYGDKDEAAGLIRVRQDSLQDFSKEKEELLSTVFTHDFVTFTYDEVSSINIPGFSVEQIDLFISALLDPSDIPEPSGQEESEQTEQPTES